MSQKGLTWGDVAIAVFVGGFFGLVALTVLFMLMWGVLERQWWGSRDRIRGDWPDHHLQARTTRGLHLPQ